MREMRINDMIAAISKKHIVFAALAIIAIGCIIVGILDHPQQSEANVADIADNGVRPDYQTVLPIGKSASTLGGWKRVSPPGDNPVFAYEDKIGDVTVSVSEQPLPKPLQNNSNEQIAAMAKSGNYNEKIEVSDTTAYIGTSAKGPQSVILTKVGLLILIKSEKKIDIKAWTTYIASLNSIDANHVPKY